MLKPVRMSKVRAICLKPIAPSVIKALHNLSVLHLSDSKLPETERAGPLPSFDEVSPRLLKMRSIMEAMNARGKQQKKKLEIEDPLREADSLIAESEKLFALLKQKEELHKALEANLSSQRALADLAGLDINFPSLSCDSLQFALLKCGADKARAAASALSKRKNCAFASAKAQGPSHVLLVALPKSEDTKPLEQFGQVSPLPLLSSTPKRELSSLRVKESSLREEISSAEKKVSHFSESRLARALAIDEALSIEADRAQAAAMFGSTASLYYIEGWVEFSRFHYLQSELRQKFGKKVLVTEAPIGHHDTPPTLLSNPAQAGPFQFVVEFLSLPQYSEIDPTLIIAVAIPVLYALIFGDAGYAVLSFLLASYLVKTSRPGSLLNQVSRIWMISAIPAFFAGIIFDEYFGFAHEHLGLLLGFGHIKLYEGLQRVSSITTLMLITIIIGTVHLAAGFILGAINEWEHSRKHAMAKLCWLGIEISGFFVVASLMFGAFPFLSLPALALFGLSVLGLLITEGPIAVFEIPGLASNIMSYIRIAAVGVGGVILAEAINELLLPRFELSPLGIIIFIITLAIYLGVHAIACIISMFESFVHGARLNVVEFFGKFYKGNGLRFAPFTARRVYSQEAT